MENEVLHYFLIDDSLGPDHEIIIDPTYLQFFKDGPAPVFIGTREDQANLFKSRPKGVKTSQHFTGKPLFLDRFSKGENVDVNELVDQIYGFGKFKTSRVKIHFPDIEDHPVLKNRITFLIQLAA